MSEGCSGESTNQRRPSPGEKGQPASSHRTNAGHPAGHDHVSHSRQRPLLGGGTRRGRCSVPVCVSMLRFPHWGVDFAHTPQGTPARMSVTPPPLCRAVLSLGRRGRRRADSHRRRVRPLRRSWFRPVPRTPLATAVAAHVTPSPTPEGGKRQVETPPGRSEKRPPGRPVPHRNRRGPPDDRLRVSRGHDSWTIATPATPVAASPRTSAGCTSPIATIGISVAATSAGYPQP